MYPTGNANTPVITSKFLPSKVICTGSLSFTKANNSNISTPILNDCIHTNQCCGTDCSSSVPFFEKAVTKTKGKGIKIAKAGRGGSLLKSEKKPL